MKKDIGELKINYEKHHIIDELSSLLYSNEISIGKSINTEINPFNEENHKVRQKKAHIKKIIKSKKSTKKKPKFKKQRKDIKPKSKNINNYEKNKKDNLNIDSKEFYTIWEEIKTQSNSPEKKAQFQIKDYKKMSLENSSKLEKESINKGFEVNDNIIINEEDNYVISSKKSGTINIENFGAFNQNNKKEEGSSVPAVNNNEINSYNKRENDSFKNKNFSESLLYKNTIKKKLLFSPQELENANINNKDSKTKIKGFEVIYENSIGESNEVSSKSQGNNFISYEDDYQNLINIDDIDKLNPKNCNEDEDINLDLINDINFNFTNKKNN